MIMKEKNILVVGGRTGIGKALVEKLREGGARVWMTSRQPLEIEGSQVYEVGTATQLELPEILNGLVYCPGTINLQPFCSLQAEQFRKDFEVNVMGAVEVLQHAEKALKRAGGASVLLFSTVAVQQGMPFHSSVAAAKGAVEGLVRSLAAEWASAQIRVNAIAPSLTETPLAQRLLGSDERRKAAAGRHPLKRVGTPRDMAAMAAYLLGDDASWITGQVIAVDGGLSRLRLL